ncbi:MAG: hypothetical protein CVV21_05985 [Candidatus Goldiibacteriota bacterium HGW-Goldbacteria-1]|nr:MAG: hypothetical protein CVV21_05985 [Candidatus Goldiibacteriota bacterium HGW-Goldbacteria-1]
MEEKDLIEKLNKARLSEINNETGKYYLKNALINCAVSKNSVKKPDFIHRYAAALSIAAVFAFTAVTIFVVDNMDDGDKFNKSGGVWSTYSDIHQGGNSYVWPPEFNTPGEGFIMSRPGYGNTGWAVRITGTTGNNLGYNYNYIGVVVRFDNKSQCPQCQGSDISKYNGIRFKIKGNTAGGSVYFILPHESNNCIKERMTCESLTNYADYQKDITSFIGDDWNEVNIVFRDDLKQPEWAGRKYGADIEAVLKNVHLFKWQHKNGNGAAIEIWIDDVVLF